MTTPYIVKATPVEGVWNVEVPDVERTTQAIEFERVEAVARELIEIMTSQTDVSLDIQVQAPLRDSATPARRASRPRRQYRNDPHVCLIFERTSPTSSQRIIAAVETEEEARVMVRPDVAGPALRVWSTYHVVAPGIDGAVYVVVRGEREAPFDDPEVVVVYASRGDAERHVNDTKSSGRLGYGYIRLPVGDGSSADRLGGG